MREENYREIDSGGGGGSIVDKRSGPACVSSLVQITSPLFCCIPNILFMHCIQVVC